MFKSRETRQKEKEKVKDALIEKLVKQVEELKAQIASLQEELELERNKPKEGYEEAKRLIEDLNNKKQEYQSLVDEVYKIKESYDKKLKETKEIKEKYSAELDKLIISAKNNIENKTKPIDKIKKLGKPSSV